MSITLLIRTSERVRVVSPWDPAIDAATKARLLADDLDVLAGRTIEGATYFELRGLSAGEVRRLRPLLPAPPENVRAWLGAVSRGDTPPTDANLDRDFSAWQSEVGFVYLRAALVSAAVEGWPTERESYLGLDLWPEWATDGLPHDTGRWLGSLAYKLSMLPPEKRRPFGSPPDEPSGTTAAEAKTTSGVSG